jgi:hypothetical protein
LRMVVDGLRVRWRDSLVLQEVWLIEIWEYWSGNDFGSFCFFEDIEHHFIDLCGELVGDATYQLWCSLRSESDGLRAQHLNKDRSTQAESPHSCNPSSMLGGHQQKVVKMKFGLEQILCHSMSCIFNK